MNSEMATERPQVVIVRSHVENHGDGPGCHEGPVCKIKRHSPQQLQSASPDDSINEPGASPSGSFLL